MIFLHSFLTNAFILQLPETILRTLSFDGFWRPPPPNLRHMKPYSLTDGRNATPNSHFATQNVNYSLVLCVATGTAHFGRSW